MKAPLVFGIFLVAVFLLYGSTLSYPFFIFDDPRHITANPFFHPLNAQTFAWIFTESIMTLPYSAWATLTKVFGTQSPIPFRALNLLLHALNSGMVFIILKRMLPLFWTHRPERENQLALSALFGAAIFCVHPVQVETVVWISCLKDLLAAFFSLLSLLIFLKAMQSPGPSANGRLQLAWSAVALLAGMLAKISAATYVLLLFWLYFAFFAQKHRKFLALLAVSLVGFALAFYNIYARHVPETLLPFIPTLGQRLIIFTDAFFFNLRQLFLPYEYYFLHGRTPLRILLNYSAAPGFMITATSGLLAGLFALSGWSKQRSVRAANAVVWISLISMLPTLGLIPFAHQNLSTTADHYLYLAVLGVALGAGLVLPVLAELRKPLFWGTVLIVAANFGTKTWIQQQHWKTPKDCLQHTLEINPLSDTAHEAMGFLLAREGQRELALSHLLEADAIRSSVKIVLAESVTAPTPETRVLPDFYKTSGALKPVK